MAYTTIDKAKEHFTPFTYTGTGSAGTRTGVGFTPDMFIHKNRDNTQGWGLIDVLRGNGNYISPNTTTIEKSDVGNYGIATDGYTFPSGDAFFNNNNMVTWNWKAGGAGVSNTDGDISSTVSANTTSGFSIVTYSGNGSASQSIGHGLGVKPQVVIVKCRTGGAESWIWWQDTTGNGTADKRLLLSGNQANYNNYFASFQNDTFTTPSQVDTAWNGSSGTYVAYCFAQKTGFSRFGTYEGTGGNNFIYTGFKPSFFLLKSYDQTVNWKLIDSARDPFNDLTKTLRTNENTAEDDHSAYSTDFVSNGVMLRNGNANMNQPGGSYNYIYMAFGQSLVGSNNVPCTAR